LILRKKRNVQELLPLPVGPQIMKLEQGANGISAMTADFCLLGVFNISLIF